MEFSATKQTPIDLERAILGLKQKKDAIVTKKMDIQNKLSELRDKRDKLNINSDEAIEITNRRKALKKDNYNYEIEIKDINLETKNKRMLLLEVNNYLKSNNIEDKNKKELIKLRDKYSEFSGDHTRVGSMRIMAKKFADELQLIINL